jgi:hypothetical protein
LFGGGEELLHDALEQQDREHDPDLACAADQQQRQQSRGQQQVRGDHRSPAVPAVGEDSGQSAEQHLGHE